jgi:hypothetical protein
LIRTLLILAASSALLLTPLVTICHHGETGHVEFIGHCHDPGGTPAPAKEHRCCPHGHHHHAQPEPGETVALTAPPLTHQRIGEIDLAGPGSRSGFEPVETGVAGWRAGSLEPRFEASTCGFRGREPPPRPPLILLTRSLLL